MTRSATRIAVPLVIVILLFAGLLLAKANFYIMPFARITADGQPISGYVHRDSHRWPPTRLIVTRSELGRRRSYLVGTEYDSHGVPFAWYCDDWSPPRWPAFLFPHVNPPCIHWYAAEDPPPPVEPKRNTKTESNAVEFTANDGKRIRVSWR